MTWWSLPQINHFQSRRQGVEKLTPAFHSREKHRNMFHIILILHAKPVDHCSLFLPRQADINKDDNRKQRQRNDRGPMYNLTEHRQHDARILRMTDHAIQPLLGKTPFSCCLVYL